jgi:membrane-associated phospholipid phosphatase
MAGPRGRRPSLMISRLDARATSFVASCALPAPLEFLVWPGALLFGWRGVLGCCLPLLCLRYSLKGMLLGLMGGALGQLINRTIKQVVRRPRPPLPSPLPRRSFAVRVPRLGDDGDAPSFPSGDSMAAGFVGATVYLLDGGAPYGAFFLPVWGCLGRVYFHCHYVADAVVGALIGWSSVCLVREAYGGERWEQNIEPWHVLPLIPVFVGWMKFGRAILTSIGCIR